MTSNPDIQQLRFAIKDRINKKGHKYRTNLMIEKRKNFDFILIVSIIVGIIYYIGYLMMIVKAVNGL